MIRTFLAATISFAAFVPLFASALTPAQPRLVRAPNASAVYYALPDGRRFTFPNERIYRSWYADFSSVQSISEQDLSSYRLAGAVVYHPGQLVKVTTDPKVYVVVQNGVLRWLENETTARRVAGAHWASIVHDLPDEFFSTYTIGNPLTEQDSTFALAPLLTSSSIAENQQLLENSGTPPTTPTATTTQTIAGDIVIRTSDSRGVYPADSLGVSVYAKNAIPESTRLYANNLLVQACTRAPACSYTLTHPTQSSLQRYELRAEAVFANGLNVTRTVSVPVRDPNAGGLRLIASNTEGRMNAPIDVRAEWKDVLVGAQQTQIIVDGLEQKVCFNATTCTYVLPLAKPIGSSYLVHAVVDDTSGKRWITPTSTIRIVANERPIITAGMNAATIYVGESLDVNAQASDDDVVREMTIWRNGVRVASCNRGSCSYFSEPTTTAEEITIRVTATDSEGNTTEHTLDPVVVLPKFTS